MFLSDAGEDYISGGKNALPGQVSWQVNALKISSAAVAGGLPFLYAFCDTKRKLFCLLLPLNVL